MKVLAAPGAPTRLQRITADFARAAGSQTLYLAIALAVLLVHGGHAQGTIEPLPFSTSYLVTGDYAVGSVDFTSGAGIIPMKDVPADADILAAFLYWETIAPSWVDPRQTADLTTFRGSPIKAVRVKSIGKPLTGNTASCFTASGSLTMTMFRADVLRLLPRLLDKDGKPTGKLLVNDLDLASRGLPLHRVTLPEAGSANQIPQSAGATMVVVYRHSSLPLRKIVVHDGIYIEPSGGTTTQTIRGFYQSDPANQLAKITHIVGSGANNTSETLTVTTAGGSKAQTNPFPGSSKSSDRSWAAFTLDLNGKLAGTDAAASGPYGESITSKVTHSKKTPYDCLAWAATWFSTTVKDSEHDGIPDRLEQPGQVLDPDGTALPDVHAIGARPDQRDMLIEVNALRATSDKTYGSADAPYDSSTNIPPAWAKASTSDGGKVVTVTAGPHNHMPTSEVLSMVGDAYKLMGIKARFDVGNVTAYHALGAEYAASVGTADEYLVPTSEAKGGEHDEEQACSEVDPSCHFPAYPGTIGWGFSLTKHMLGTDRNPDLPRFDRNREGLFRYLLYAHFRGRPKSLPCLDAPLPLGAPTLYESPLDETCGAAVNGSFEEDNYHVPSTSSGAAALPGDRALVTLGGWEHFLGTTFVRASTTFHELAHNLGIWHGGAAARLITHPTTGAVTKVVEPNCKPNYLSVTSYLFQVHGLKDGGNIARIALSDGVNAPLNEINLTDMSIVAEGGAPLAFRPAWFAPLGNNTLVDSFSYPAATRLCNGLALPPGVSYARVEAASLSGMIDWATNGLDLSQPTASQDINLDGVANTSLTGFNDWASIRLDQIGSGHVLGGAISNGGSDFGGSDFGGSDFGGSDFGGSDFGGSDFGGSDFGGSDFGGSDFGGLDLDGSDFGGSDFGGSDFGGNTFAGDAELTHRIARSLVGGEGSSPSSFRACVIGPIGSETAAQAEARCPGGPAPLHRIRLRWNEPTIGTVFSGTRPDGTGNDGYVVTRYRVNPDGTIAPTSKVEVCGTQTTPSCGPPSPEMTFTDGEELPDAVTFRYFATAVFVENDPIASNLLPRSAPTDAAVTAVNNPPVAVADARNTNEDTQLIAALPGAPILTNDTDADSGSWFVAVNTLPSYGALALNPNGTFTYTPNPDFYGSDSFTYRTNNGPWPRDVSVPLNTSNSNEVTVVITVNPVNDPPSFVKGVNQTVVEDGAAPPVSGWATNISAGPPNETAATCPGFAPPVCGQAVSFLATNDNPVLFTAAGQPAVGADGTLTYVPALNANGVATVTVSAKDTGGLLSGGVDTSAPQTFTIKVAPVNDAPAVIDPAQGVTTNEDTDTILMLKGGDLETATANLLFTVTVPPQHGSLSMWTATATGTQVTYTPISNYHGADSFSYKVTDRGDPDNCAISPPLQGCAAPLDSAVDTVSIDVVSVNDAPAGADNSVTMPANTIKVFTPGDFGFTDPFDNNPANGLSRVRITTAPAAGTLTIGGAPVVAGTTFVPESDIANGQLKFTPAANASGWPYAIFTFQVEDNGGLASGGINLDPTPNTMTINLWVATTTADCAPAESPAIALAGHAIAMGIPGGDTDMNQCIHGASARLPPLSGGNSKYQVTFSYNLFTWDSYTPLGAAGTGYWDSFSVTVSKKPYRQLTLGDPLTAGQSGGDLLGGWVWGGTNFSDGFLECLPGGFACAAPPPPAQGTIVVSGNTDGDTYVNVVLDTKTAPEANHAHRSYGTITIVSVVQVP